jgi:hypothetical protein
MGAQVHWGPDARVSVPSHGLGDLDLRALAATLTKAAERQQRRLVMLTPLSREDHATS